MAVDKRKRLCLAVEDIAGRCCAGSFVEDLNDFVGNY